MTRSTLLSIVGLVLGAAAVAVTVVVTAPASGDGQRPAQASSAVTSAPGPAHDDHATPPTDGPGNAEAHDRGENVADEATHAQIGGNRSPAARRLIRRTRRLTARWSDVASAQAAGFRSIGDEITGYEHYVHRGWTADARVLDPRRPESLVYRVDGEERELVSAMYILPPGSTMDDVPDLGDDAARWHIHDDLCWDDDGRVAGIHREGRCVPGGTLVVTPPMLHVWLVEHPCGPFAGLEGHGGGCGRDHG